MGCFPSKLGSAAQHHALDTVTSPRSAANQDRSVQQAQRPVEANGSELANSLVRTQNTSRTSLASLRVRLDKLTAMTFSTRAFKAASPPKAGTPVDLGLHFSAGSGRPLHDELAILNDKQTYKTAVMPLVPYSQKSLREYPTCRARNHGDVFVEGPDGKVRRFPQDRNTQDGVVYGGREGIPDESISRNFAGQINYIYDAHRDEIHETLAEYTVTRSAAAEFRVRGKPVKSINSAKAVYPLPGGKWMIPQSGILGCTFACEEMILAEGKSARLVAKQTSISNREKKLLGKGEPTHLVAKYKSLSNSQLSARMMGELWQSLAARTGQPPKTVHAEGLTSAASIKKLKASIAAYGPCIFSIDMHARVLDRIEEGVEGHLLTVRDPFSASFLTIKNHEAFWGGTPPPSSGSIETRWQEVPRYWDAIFLPNPH